MWQYFVFYGTDSTKGNVVTFVGNGECDFSGSDKAA